MNLDELPGTYRKWVYAKAMEDGVLARAQFELQEVPMPELRNGEALARIKLINVHSATRFRMASGMTELGETDRANFACAQIVASKDSAFAVGDIVACQAGWQEYQVLRSDDESVGYGPATELVKALNGTHSQWCYVFRRAMVKMWLSEVLMDVFGTSGTTAYFGLRECGPLLPTDVVAIAGTSGSVGSIAAQLAKAAGCYVVGFAGGPEQCARVLELTGVDRCVDYRASDFGVQVAATCPDGIDVFADGIGGSFTDVILAQMKPRSRMFAYGSASTFYDDDLEMPDQKTMPLRAMFGLSNDHELVIAKKNIKVEAWIVHDFYHERLGAEDDLSRHLLSGALKPITTVVEGFENLPDGVMSLYENGRDGKLQIRFC